MISSVSIAGLPSLAAQQKAVNAAPAPTEENPAQEQDGPLREQIKDAQRQIQPSEAGQGTGSPLDAELTAEEEQAVRELQQRDQEVRAHEQAHKNVAGPYAGAIQYQTTTGPDGRQYAVGGSVDIDVSPIPNNPEATVRKMDIVVRAALAPAEPSSEDFAVARAAQQARIQAQREAEDLRQAEQEEVRNANNPNENSALTGEQQGQLQTLLQNIGLIDSPSKTRGSLFDAIN